MNNKNTTHKYFFSLINPFISAIISLRDIRDGVSHRILYLWFLIFGIGFCALDESADSFRYVEDFIIEHRYSWAQYLEIVREWFTFESNVKDIYTLTVNVFVGHFSGNYHWAFFIYAVIFGFFYIKSLRIFIKNEKISKNYVFYSLLFMFCFSNPIFNINGVRFWTAAWIGVYVALKLFLEKDYKKLPLLLLLPLIHGTSVIWIVIMGVALLLQRFQSLSIIIYVASAFVTATSYLNILSDFSDLLPQFMQNQIWSYTESDMALERLAGQSEYGAVYADFLMALPKYFQILMCILLILKRNVINRDKYAGRLLSVMLALAAITNFLSGIPSMGRFQVLVIPFLIVVWANNYKIMSKYDRLFIIVPLVYAYSMLHWFRHMSGVTEPYLYVFPTPFIVIKYLLL